MPDSVEQRLAALPTLTKAALHGLWMHLFQSTPPSQLRRDLMIPILAYRIQGKTSLYLSQSQLSIPPDSYPIRETLASLRSHSRQIRLSRSLRAPLLFVTRLVPQPFFAGRTEF